MSVGHLRKMAIWNVAVLFVSCSSNDQIDRRANWDVTIGVMTKRLWGKSSVGEFRYDYKGKTYQCKNSRGIDIYGSVTGEKYILKVNPENPEEYVPIDWRPLFTDDEECDTVIGTVDKVFQFRFGSKQKIFAKHAINFSYYVDDEEFERSQALPPDFEQRYKSLKKREKYRVVYSTNNPQRAIMIIDK